MRKSEKENEERKRSAIKEKENNNKEAVTRDGRTLPLLTCVSPLVAMCSISRV